MRDALIRDQHGVSLVDLMVGLAIGMAAMLVTLNVAVSFDARRRSVTGMADAQGHAAFAITLMSRELRMAGHGLGLPATLGCTVHRAAAGVADASMVLRPAVITPGPGESPDGLHTLSGGAGSAPPAWLIAPYTTDTSALQVDTTVGMAVGDYLLLQSAGLPDCALLKIAGFGTGSSYAVRLQSVAGLLPGTVFGINSAAINTGALRYRRYLVDAQQRLRMESFLPDSGQWVGATLADGIASLQLQYGFDARPGIQTAPQVNYWSDDLIDADGNGHLDTADWRRLLAIRIAVVVRSDQRIDGDCNAVAPQWLAGNPTNGELERRPIHVDHLPDWSCWRYRVLQTEVPLRNLIWGDD